MDAQDADRPTFVMRQSEIVWLGGADALLFLDRMSSNHVRDVRPDAGCATAITTDEGRVVDLVAAHVSEDGIALATSAPGAGAVVTEHLSRYVLYGDDVRITNARTQVASARLFGPNAAEAASSVTGMGADSLDPGAWRRSLDGDRWLMRHPDPGPGGFDVVVPEGPAVEELSRELRRQGAADAGAEGYTRLRIERLLPAWGHEIDGDANPLELGLRAAVDFDKGCYVGQEVVARLDSHDNVQRVLVRLVLQRAMGRGASVLPDRSTGDAEQGRSAGTRAAQRPGRITSVSGNPAGPWLALALVPVAMVGASTVLVRDADGATVARIGSRVTNEGEARERGA